MDRITRNEIIGFIGGILIISSLIPQLLIILYNKTSKNISIITYIILFIGQCVWTLYGILNNDLQVTITNIIAGFLTILIIIVAIYYRN